MEKPKAVLAAILFSTSLTGCGINPVAEVTPQKPKPGQIGYVAPVLTPPSLTSESTPQQLPSATRTFEPTITPGPSPTEIQVPTPTETLTPTPPPTSFALQRAIRNQIAHNN